MDQNIKTLDGLFVAHIYKSSITQIENKVVTIKNIFAESTFLAFNRSTKPNIKAKITDNPWE